MFLSDIPGPQRRQKVLGRAVLENFWYNFLGFEKNIPFSLLGKNTPSKIEVMYDGVVTTLPTQKSTVIIVSLAGILLAIFVFILLYFVKGLNNNKYEKLKKLFSRKKSA